jgi:hypothetical protein
VALRLPRAIICLSVSSPTPPSRARALSSSPLTPTRTCLFLSLRPSLPPSFLPLPSLTHTATNPDEEDVVLGMFDFGKDEEVDKGKRGKDSRTPATPALEEDLFKDMFGANDSGGLCVYLCVCDSVCVRETVYVF